MPHPLTLQFQDPFQMPPSEVPGEENECSLNNSKATHASKYPIETASQTRHNCSHITYTSPANHRSPILTTIPYSLYWEQKILRTSSFSWIVQELGNPSWITEALSPPTPPEWETFNFLSNMESLIETDPVSAWQRLSKNIRNLTLTQVKNQHIPKSYSIYSWEFWVQEHLRNLGCSGFDFFKC